MTDLKELYKKVKKTIETIPLSSLYPGFRLHKFALYNSEMIIINDLIIPYNEAFMGNTSIFYEGEYIAIWNIEMDPVSDIDILSSNLIHEMFHCFQSEEKEKRFPDDLEILMYPDSNNNYNIKFYENSLLIKAAKAKTIKEKTDLLTEFYEARKYRESIIKEAIKNETKTETVEGLAEYIGTISLKFLSTKKYEERIENYLSKLSDTKLIFDIRRISYFVGVIYLILLSELNIDFVSYKLSEKETIYDLAKGNVALIPFQSKNENLLNEYNLMINERQKKINEMKKEKKTILKSPLSIYGYDPMNMYRVEDEIFCSHFIFLSDGELNSFIKGPILLSMVKGSKNMVESYYTI
ncbi:MAG: hypothetical protein H6687_01285 [Bacillales bacterium]|nr:hypothetical protein [Bacillales bacterium]